jgi:regulatory protein
VNEPGRRRTTGRRSTGRQRRGAEGKPSTPPGDTDPREAARAVCLRLLAVRPRTRAELATALRRRGIPDEDAAAVLERYDEVGMIDDAAFARAWVTTRHHGRGLARGALARELRQRGVDAEAIAPALGEVDDGAEAAMARDLVARRLRSMANVPPEAAFRRLVGMLARKGYPAGLAVRTVRDALSGTDEGAGFAAEVDVDSMTESIGGAGRDGESDR